YWNELCAENSSKLWLPTATDSQGSDLSLSNGWSSKTAEKSWFSVKLLKAAQPLNSETIFSPFLDSLRRECMDSVNIDNESEEKSEERLPAKTKKIRIYPKNQTTTSYERWVGTRRFVYNRTVEYLKTVKGARNSWRKIADETIIPALPEW